MNKTGKQIKWFKIIPAAFILLAVVIIFYFILQGFWGRNGGDRILTIFDVIGILFLAVAVLVPAIFSYKKYKGKIYKSKWFTHLTIITIIVIVVDFFFVKYLAYVAHAVLKERGTVTNAKIIRTEWYDTVINGWAIREVNNIKEADLIRVYLELPDGQLTDLSLSRGGFFPANPYNGPYRANLLQELLACRMKVRYWNQGTWLVRPELEFTEPTMKYEIQLSYILPADGSRCNKYPLGNLLDLYRQLK